MAYEVTQTIQEHEPRVDKSSGHLSYQPTEEEEKAIKLVDKLFQKAKQARRAYDQKWLDNYKMFRGKQWKDVRPTYRHSEVINLVFRAIQSEVPIITDSMPRPEFIPQEPSDFELSKILNDILSSDWDRNNWAQIVTEIIYDAHFYGAGFGYLGYDPDLDDGMGSVKFCSSDPFNMYPDPYSTNVNVESRYYLEAKPEDLEKLKQEYPDVAQYLKADVEDIVRKQKDFSEQIRYRSPTDNRTIYENNSSYDQNSNNEALKITCYLKDTTMIEEEDQKEDGSIQYIQKLKYPNGRKIVTISGVLCEDGPIEYDDQKFPYARLLNYILPREFWGISEIEQLESPQRIFNKLISFTLDCLTLMGNPVWVVDTTSGIDVENLFTRPGLILEKEPGSEVRREEGTHLQPYVLQLVDRIKLMFDDISGSNDSSRGVRPEGVTAASAISALQQATQTRIRQKSRNLDAFMQDIGQMYLSRVFQYYTVPRVFRITNNQNVTKYFKFHVDKSVDELGNEKKVARVREYETGLDGQAYLGPEKEFEIRRMFDVKISSGSGLPFEKERIEAQSIQLFDRGIIDNEEVLKRIEYQNYESAIKRMAEKAALMAQQQPPPKV